MITDLQPGTPFVVMERGGFRLWIVSSDRPGAYAGVRHLLQAGEVVHRCVWKGDRLESRASYTLRPGDAVWVDTGIPAHDFTRPPSRVTGYALSGGTIHVNRFDGGPAWLRRVGA